MFENIVNAIGIINHPKGLNIGARHISISTSGLVPKIYELADSELQSTLAISLHAPNHKLRAELMPIENKYPIDELKKALLNYVEKTGRRITFEYSLVAGVNDSGEDAKELIAPEKVVTGRCLSKRISIDNRTFGQSSVQVR